MEYRTDIDSINASQFEGFFEGWQTHPDGDGLLRILRGSAKRIIAIEDGRVVGFITAITDGGFAAYIPLLEVLPAYRDRGIGSALVSQMLDELSSYYMIDLVCDEKLNLFYERFNMKKMNAMGIRIYENRTAPTQ